MQLDRTEIVIRQRATLELFDLSLIVLRKHIKSIMLTSALLGIPLLVVDVLMTQWMLGEDAYLVAEDLESPRFAMRSRQAFHLIMLYALQFPLISLPTTVFLGNQVFFESVSVREIVAKLVPIAGRVILVLGVIRLGLVCLAFELFVDRTLLWDWRFEFWMLGVLGFLCLAMRAGWPYAPEILGLELCPLATRAPGEISYRQRSRGLHSLLMADHVSRFTGSVMVAFLIGLMLLAAILFCQGTLTGDWLWNDWINLLAVPAILWVVGMLLAVFRFLTYLDTRIRLEGWEIELRLKAEATRLRPAPVMLEVGDNSREEAVVS